jgi:hypothetical protein
MANILMRLILVGLLGILLPASVRAGQDDTMNVARVKMLIEGGAPIGSASSEVMAFLDANHIEHSAYLAGQSTIHAIVRNVSITSTTNGSISIIFYFDENRKLRRYTVKSVFTGP